MLVTLDLPDEVKELVEFIPKEELNEILIALIYEGICSKVNREADNSSVTGGFETEQIMQKIQELLMTQATQGVMESPRTFTKDVHVERKDVATSDILKVKEYRVEEIKPDEDDDDFLDGFDDLLK